MCGPQENAQYNFKLSIIASLEQRERMLRRENTDPNKTT